jgi:ABC-2 type transport system permease protein
MIILVGSIVLSTQAFKIAEEINYGKLSDYLIKPIDYFHYNLIRDLADKSINIFFAFFEMIFFYIIFKPVLLFPQNIINIIWFITFLIAAVLLYYQLSISLSFIGFWSRETWAPRFLFLIIVSFLSGTYFPLNIFPNALYFMIKILPFTYLIYFPITVFLEKQTTQSIVSALVIILTWNFILYFLNKILWKKGLKIYTAEGL